MSKRKKLDICEIYENHYYTIVSVLNDFKFMDLNAIWLQLMIFEEIKKILDKDFDEKTLLCHLLNNLRNNLDNVVKEQLSDREKSENIINNYINLYIKNTNNSNLLLNFIKLNDFFEKYNLILDYDLSIKLVVENKNLYKILKKIVKENLDLIINDEITYLFHPSSSLLIKTFCEINNIDISNEYKILNQSMNGINDPLNIFLNEVKEAPKLSDDLEKEIITKTLEGDINSREVLIRSKLGLVIFIAKKYRNKGLDFIDLIQEGSMGLLRAIDKFDVTKNCKFSTYATWWIRQYIVRAIYNKGRSIRKPSYIEEKIRLLNNAQDKLKFEYNREPTLLELAKELNFTLEEVKKLQILNLDPLYFNDILDSVDNKDCFDFISSQEELPEDIAMKKVLSNYINELFLDSKLSEKERVTLILRFGLSDGVCRSLEEISRIYEVTPERIRQIEARAIKKIRNSSYVKKLSSYMDVPEFAEANIDEFRKLCRIPENKNKAYFNFGKKRHGDSYRKIK